jgi:hypothetical protein
MAGRIAGIFYFKFNGIQYSARGNWSYNLGQLKAESVLDAGGKRIGLKETPQVPFIEGEITSTGDLDLKTLLTARGGTGTLELANGKTVVITNADQVGEGTAQTDDSNVPVRFEGDECEEVL